MMHCTLWPGFKLNAKRIRATAMVSLLFLASSVTKGQISFTPGSNTISIDFSNTTPASVGTNTGTAFTAAGFSPNPTNAQAGRLNSNAWSVRGISDGTLNFGGTSTSGDAARGSFATSQSVGGVYAYVGTPATTTNPMMMIQPAADDFTPGSLVLRFRNDDPVLPITAVQLTYDVWVRNDAGRSQTIRINRSIDDVNYTNEPAFDYNTPEAISGSTVVSAGTFSQNMTDFDVPATYFGYIQWAIDDDTTGSGNRDEIFLDNIQITVTYGPPCTPPAAQTTLSPVSGIGPQQATINYTRPGGTGGFLAVMVQNAVLSQNPINSVVYTANANFGSGQALGNGYVVYNGNAPTGNFTVFNLTPGTNYRIYIFEYNTVSNPCYKTVSPAVSLFSTTTPVTNPAGFFRSRITGNWNTAASWESANAIGGPWVTADLKPTSSAAGIDIRTGHTITLTAAESARLLTISGTLSSDNISSGGWPLNLVDATGTDLIITSGGVLNLYGNSPINNTVNTATTARVEGGATVRVQANHPPSQADDFAHLAGRSAFLTDAVFEWNTNAFTPSSTNIIYFNPNVATEYPIFRMNQTTNFQIGGAQLTTINGHFENNANNAFQFGGIKTFRDGISGSGNLTQLAGCGEFRINSNNARLGGSGTLELNGTTGLVIISGTTTLISNKTINNNNVNVNSGARLNCSTYVISGSTNFSLLSGGRLGMGSPDGITTGAAGNIQTTGRNFNTGSEYYYMGPGNQTSGNALPSTVTRLDAISSNGGTVTLSGSLTVTTTLNFANNASLNIGDNNTLNVQNNILYNAPTGGLIGFTGTPTSELLLTGIVAQNIYFKTGAALGKLSLNKTAGVFVTLPVASAGVEVYTGIEFAPTHVGGLNLNNRSVTLKSTYAKTAYLGRIYGTLSNATNCTVERYIPTGIDHAKSWQFLNVPLSANATPTINTAWQEGATFANENPNPGFGTMITGNVANATTPAIGFDAYTLAAASIKTFDPATESWVNSVLNTKNTPVINPNGYMLFVRGDRSVTTYNAPANATVLRATGRVHDNASFLPPAATVTANRFQAVGNPYASAIDFTLLARTGGVDNTFYVWDPLMNGYYGLGGFQAISSSTGFVPSPGGTTNYPTGVPVTTIQSGQAFLVYATGSGGSVSFEEADKVTSSDNVFRQPHQPVPLLQATLFTEQGVVADGNIVVFNNRYSNAYDGNDAVKHVNSGENFFVLLKNSPGKVLAVETRKDPRIGDTIHYGIRNLKNGRYRMQFNVPAGTRIQAGGNHSRFLQAILTDRYTGTRTPIALEGETTLTIEVTSEAASKQEGRFYLVFTGTPPVSQHPGRNETGKPSPEIIAGPNPITGNYLDIILNDLQEDVYNISINNSAGKPVYQTSIRVHDKQRRLRWDVPASLPGGSYTLIIRNKEQQWVKQLVR
ncbi:MAG TPA: hypothetical protein PKY29_01050 [Ferruginibacter sp.]|nr:hypothetical protein [Ferruginibacter sp.]HRQ19866.1 hypothetical protein [Ferruginibacter sp.]